MITVHISAPFSKNIDESIIKDTLISTLSYLSVPSEYDITIVIDNDRNIRELNKKYRHIDKPTDVLSFTIAETNPENDHVYLGDIVISYDSAMRNVYFPHLIMNELQTLCIHGTLHLLGYNHEEFESKQEMWKIQNEILNILGIKALSLDE